MKVNYYSVFDRQTKAYMPPFAAQAHGSAIRSFSDAVGSKEHEFCRHPEDYVLFHVGVFDDATGAFSTDDVVKLITALECINTPDA